ncbi:TetR family transcriptional regulator [Leuconostoc litchii]|uniref:TetR/AcrR family transcriptional regulator n=1 Tax=Leuconostoc litchii TaxID=1981069 RepID=A0A6P2CMF1_9LACO|nr:TetR/AcrR family transcriptional regulator [Leuconostoc litchii]TYC46754.1 TetR/AcrR family transcriptional regulator [Leuconostoc litchii]GMA70637.1 TetR family transcriptional regulator [Leuconostoc litchii]
MSNKTDARVIRTKYIIQTETILLLSTQPDFSITMLLSRANITRGTFYKYYRNKEHLISEINDALINDLLEHTQETFKITDMINTVSKQAAFYNAVLNHDIDKSFSDTLYSRLRTQMATHTNDLSDEERRAQQYQWEVINAGFWAIMAKWLADNMNISQVALFEEFTELWRLNTNTVANNGLNLFDFSTDEI